jgi:hypothetical protein
MSCVRRTGIALLVAGTCAACGSSQPAPRPLHVRNSYLGLDCGNAFPCAHLGIAVWLNEPESRVTVTIHGRHVALTTHYDHRRDWIGFVRDAVAERLSDDMRREVRLTVEAIGPDGTARRATLKSPVSPGWG